MKITTLFLFLFFIAQNSTQAQNSKKYSEEKALECISDWYDFYNADEEYKDPKVRRVSNNTFLVSVKYCIFGKGDACYENEMISSLSGFDRFYKAPRESSWRNKVLILRISSNTKYTVKVKDPVSF